MPNIYSDIATSIFDNEFGGDTGVITVSQISGWLSANIGGLNVLLNKNYTGDNPAIDNAAANILSKQYLVSYNTRAARNALRGVLSSSSSGDNILSVSDGDNRISFINKNETAKAFKGMSAELQTEIKELAYAYNMYESSPSQVAGYESSISGSAWLYSDPPREY